MYSNSIERYYIGQTSNLANRLISHQKGISKYTSRSKDWVLVYSEDFETRKEAIQRENEIKKKKSRKYIEYLISTSK